ncbi:MAG: translation elongation factor Ts [Acidobacteria bacterium]|nr:MAG: translation elongation factor Ts [Acidobacteriota bacterium]
MKITAQMVKELRDRTSAPMMQCKAALQEAEGSIDKAIEILRKKGIAAAAKKAGRIAADGAVGAYVHGGGRIGVLVEVNCETDFVARTDEFQELVKDVAMHIAAAEPRFVRREEVTDEALAKEREIYRAQALAEGKPEKIVDRIVDGKMAKFYEQCVLLEQPFIKDPDKTVGELLTERIAKIGENIQVRRFTRYKLGEGIEKKEENFIAEVAAQVAGRG